MIARNSLQWFTAAGSIALLFAAGCSRSPDYDIMGSLFPAWLVCVTLGILLAVVARVILIRFQIRLIYPLVAYPCMAAAFTFAIWLTVY
jgi:hypothetical protein